MTGEEGHLTSFDDKALPIHRELHVVIPDIDCCGLHSHRPKVVIRSREEKHVRVAFYVRRSYWRERSSPGPITGVWSRGCAPSQLEIAASTAKFLARNSAPPNFPHACTVSLQRKQHRLRGDCTELLALPGATKSLSVDRTFTICLGSPSGDIQVGPVDSEPRTASKGY